MKVSEVVGEYVELRDKKLQLKADFDARVKPIDERMEQIENKLLEVFEATGIDSVKTDLGTAYKSEKSTASVADKSAFLDHIKEHDDYQLLEVRANKTAVEQYKEVNEALPPGVNWRSEVTVNFRRAA